MNERFEEKFNFADMFEDSRKLCGSVQNDVKFFIQSEIDLERKRIVGEIKKAYGYRCDCIFGANLCVHDYQQMYSIINIIRNK